MSIRCTLSQPRRRAYESVFPWQHRELQMQVLHKFLFEDWGPSLAWIQSWGSLQIGGKDVDENYWSLRYPPEYMIWQWAGCEIS